MGKVVINCQIVPVDVGAGVVMCDDAQDICSVLQKEPDKARQAPSFKLSSSVDPGNPRPLALVGWRNQARYPSPPVTWASTQITVTCALRNAVPVEHGMPTATQRWSFDRQQREGSILN
jgi:hypothetical protein